MNNKNQTKMKKILKWIDKNRVKVGIWLFLFILPISLVVTAYVGSYTSNQSVYFDQEITEESEKINDFVTSEDLKAIKLDIEWDALKKPEQDPEGALIKGFYRFNIKYTPNDNFDIDNVKVTPILKTDWKNYRSVGIQKDVKTNYVSVTIDFNYALPITPLPFVSVEDPNLYLKVEYTYITAGQNVTEVEYVKFPLNDLNPKVVVPN